MGPTLIYEMQADQFTTVMAAVGLLTTELKQINSGLGDIAEKLAHLRTDLTSIDSSISDLDSTIEVAVAELSDAIVEALRDVAKNVDTLDTTVRNLPSPE